jgi:glycine cleavage system transcriptional repressor
MRKMIISVLGKDRPGIIAAVTKVMFDQGFNIEDVSQTILQNQFSGSFIATGPEEISAHDIRQAFEAHTAGFDLHFHVREMGTYGVTWTTCACDSFIITTRGPDRKGLVAGVTALLAAHNVNVSQLRAVFRGGDDPGRNIMIYEVDIPRDIDMQALRKALRDIGQALDLQINLQHKNIFEAINRI